MKRWMSFRACAGFALWHGAAAAHACTVCDSSSGRQVRSAIFEEHFFSVGFAVVAPFAVLAVAVLGVRWAILDLLEGGS